MPGEVVSSPQVENKAVVPCGSDVFAFLISTIFAFKERERRGEIQFLGDQPFKEKLCSVRPSLCGGSKQLVANHSVIVSFAGQRNAVGYGKRNFVIIFIESFDGYFEGIALSPV